ncbi:PP2C family protein-serine/threonine phosphatase [Dentiradicibacter hellwigii]|uniref:PP2C family serine/threonine-protein phosphatase n=1 Tax=Dentiradicibacter hellwigii TaxID=3149053 RepID=A0ABV4UF20_9RHOO
MKFTIYQDSRLGKRRNNEDRLAHCYSRDALLMVIADGMGGHYYGEVAAQIAVQTLIESFQRQAGPMLDNPFLFLQQSILNGHYAISDFSEQHRLEDSPRTTCVACIVQNNVAYWAHAGDSRLYLIRDGRVLTHTRDHSRVQLLLDQGVINEAQAAVHPERNRVYSCLGGPRLPEIEFSHKTPLEEGDVLVLCTDGIWNAVSDEALAKALYSDNLIHTASALLDDIDEHSGSNADNFSIIAVRWEDAYIEAPDSLFSISTQSMPIDSITTALDAFGHSTSYKSELSEEEIEQAIEEIRHAIQKYAK